MKNIGLKNYASLVSMQLNNEMAIHINPVEETSNVHYVLPLYQSRYKRPLSLQLIYNHQNLSTDLGLGKGIRSNYHMSLDYNDSEAYLTLSDGSTLTYSLYMQAQGGRIKAYKNDETNTTVSVSDNSYTQQFFLNYKDGTTVEFTPAGNKLMQKSIKFKNGEEYYFEYDSLGRMIQVKNNALKIEKLTFDYTTNDYVLIQAWKTNKTGTFEEIKAIKVYKQTAGNYLNFLWFVKILDKASSSTLLKDYYFGYSLPNGCLNINIDEQISNLGCSIRFDESIKAKSMTDELGRKTTFTKINQYCTKLIDYRGKVTELMVDKEGRLLCIKDNFRHRVVSTMFDDNNKKISSSKIMSFNPYLNGKLQVMKYSAHNALMSAELVTTPSFLSNFYQTSKCYRISSESYSSAKYIQVFEIDGNKYDVFSLGVWAKINSFGSASANARINLFFTDDLTYYDRGKQFSKEIKIKAKDIDTQQYEFYMTSAYSKQSYKYVVVELCYFDSSLSMDVIFDLYKRGLTTLFEYDADGNQTTMLEGRHISELVFNGDNTIASSQFVNYEYDEKGNVIKSIDAFGKIEEMTYDASNNLLTQSISNGTNELFNSAEYCDEECLKMTEDNNNIKIECEQSSVYIKTKDKQKYDENNKLFENYEYSEANKDQVTQKVYKDNDTTELGKINYSYLSDGKLSQFSNDGVNSRIQFIYDGYGQHYGYKINNNMFSYNTYSLINGVPELIRSSSIGMKDAYLYEYDSFDRLIKVSYSLDSSTLFEYTYDDSDNIKTIKDCKTNTTYNFKYNEDGDLVSYSYDDLVINNIIDDNNILCAKEINIGNDKIITSGHSVYKSLNNDFDSYKLSIRNNTDILLCMFDEYVITYKDTETDDVLTKHKQKIKLVNNMIKSAIDSDSTENEEYCSKDGFLTLYNLNSSNPITFTIPGKTGKNNSVAFSFKPSSSGTLLSMGDSSTASLKVQLNSSNKIVVMDNGKAVFSSVNSYKLNTWHFMCVTFDLAKKKINIKIEDDEFSTTFESEYSSLYIFTFGSSLSSLLTNIMIPQKDVITDDDYDSYFKSFKYLIALNESRKNTEGNIVKKSSKQFVRNFAYSFIPLNNGTAGFKDNTTILPIKDTILELPCLASKNSEFIYNDKIEKSAYFAMGQQLVYNFSQSSTGTLSIHACRLFKDEENVLFDLVDTNNNHFTLSIHNNKFKLLLGDSLIHSTTCLLLNNTNTWNVITFTWSKNVYSGYDVIVWLNETIVINTTLHPTQTFTTFNVHVGRNSDTTDKYGKCFNGLLEMLVFSSTFVSGSVANIISSINKQDRISYEFDSLNLLKKVKILDHGTEILTNEFEYKTLTGASPSDLTRISTLPHKEIINDDAFEYQYDVRGNVKTIKKNNSTLHQYTYDKLGRLLTADNEKYNYDCNGNITSVTNLAGTTTTHTYGYDSEYSDLLISFDGETITYDTGNTYNPISIGQHKTLTYQCSRLSTFKDTQKGFHNVYYYNNLGNRIKKVKYNNSGTLLDTTKFYYDDYGKLIYQKSTSIALSFLYDEFEQLYGFIYNGNRYYYVKNSLKVILGIVDTNGNDVVKYNYDVWGNILSINDTSGLTLETINPFRYKCYYYDEDVLMYYCKARYYVPRWRRWLTPDNPKYLDMRNVNDMNLFVYCKNNSLTYSDPTGTHFSFDINWHSIIDFIIQIISSADEIIKTLPKSETMTVDGHRITIELKDNYITNIKIYNSIQINDPSKMKEILEIIMSSSYVQFAIAGGYQFRDINSYIVEWEAHNMIYRNAWIAAIKLKDSIENVKSRSSDVDLNSNWEKDDGYKYYVLLASLFNYGKVKTSPFYHPIMLPFRP